MDKINPKKPLNASISQSIYFVLRENILNLTLKPGEGIDIKKIAELLKASRSPVRDAIMRLSEEGLVDILPQRGTRVSKIDLAKMKEEQFLRSCVEQEVVKGFLKSCKGHHIERLKHIISVQERALLAGDFSAFLELDSEFHKVFYDGANKLTCFKIIDSMSGNYRRIRFLTLLDKAIVQGVIDQHLKMVKAIQQGDNEELTTLFENHLNKISVEEKQMVLEYPDYFVENHQDGFEIRSIINSI